MAQISLARHIIKSALPRRYRFLGLSFPDLALTRSIYLEPVGDDIYVVKAGKHAIVTCSGVIRIGWTFLDIDYGPFSAFRTIPLRSRTKLTYPRVVSLWSHDWSTYYHWLVDVAPKLAAAKLHFGSDIDDVTFIYPRTLTDYEIDTVEILGIKRDKIINPRCSGEIVSDELFVLPLCGWVNVSPRVLRLRQSLIPPSSQQRRLYVARSGRRRITNEPMLFRMLQAYGFEFVPDRPRTLSQQIELFGSASHVVSPHGAGLSNIIWANDAIRILELTSAAYAPNYFINLASVLNMCLDRLVFGTKDNHWKNTGKDFAVDVNIVCRFIEEEWGL
jgi:capsular polysaccharide biosynthesis protein